MTGGPGLYWVAFRLSGVPALLEHTNLVTKKGNWLHSDLRKIQMVAEYTTDEFGTSVPQNTRIVIEVTADSCDNAAAKATPIVGTVARVMSFQTGSPHAVPRIIALLEATPGVSRRLYRQWCYDTAGLKPIRPLPVSELETVLDTLAKRDEKERDAIVRSFSWYTDALGENDMIERFLKMWVGLESVGPIINRRAHRSGWHRCKKCIGDEGARRRDNQSERGMRHAFSVVDPGKPRAFDGLKRARNKLVHGEWPLDRVRKEISPFERLATEVLAGSILAALAGADAPVGSRTALMPTNEPGDGPDISISVEIESPDPTVWGQLEDKLTVTAKLESSWQSPDGYRVKAGYEIEGEFPCEFDRDSFKITSHRLDPDGVQIEVADRPREINVNEKSREKT